MLVRHIDERYDDRNRRVAVGPRHRYESDICSDIARNRRKARYVARILIHVFDRRLERVHWKRLKREYIVQLLGVDAETVFSVHRIDPLQPVGAVHSTTFTIVYVDSIHLSDKDLGDRARVAAARDRIGHIKRDGGHRLRISRRKWWIRWFRRRARWRRRLGLYTSVETSHGAHAKLNICEYAAVAADYVRVKVVQRRGDEWGWIIRQNLHAATRRQIGRLQVDHACVGNARLTNRRESFG